LGRKAISLLLSLAHDQTRRSQYSRIRAIPQSLPPSWTSAHLACPGYHSAPPASDRPLRASGVPQTTRRSNVVRQTTRRSSGVLTDHSALQRRPNRPLGAPAASDRPLGITAASDKPLGAPAASSHQNPTPVPQSAARSAAAQAVPLRPLTAVPL